MRKMYAIKSEFALVESVYLDKGTDSLPKNLIL